MTAGARAHALHPDTATALAAAKLWLVSTESPTTCGDLPYLASPLYALIPVATDQISSMTIDETWRLYVNPAWAAATSVPEVAARMAHLVWHTLADHAQRARDLDVGPDTADAWRCAADATVAEALAGLPHGLTPPAQLGWDRGRSAEQYYAQATRLPVHRLFAPDPAAAGAAGGDQPDDTCGSACDGRARPYDLPGVDGDVGAVDVHDADALRRRVAIEWRDHAGGRGDLPGQWRRWVEQILEPRVPWQQILAAAVRQGLGWVHGHTDYTYTRISRRQAAAGGIVLPALRRPTPEVAVVIDTSASVDDGLLAQALGEIDGILASQGINDGSVTVLATDADVHDVGRVRHARDTPLGGGGGTDMTIGIDTAIRLRPRPQLIIVVTDGDTPWPAAPPPIPVIAALVGRSRPALPDTPPWATRVECVT